MENSTVAHIVHTLRELARHEIGFNVTAHPNAEAPYPPKAAPTEEISVVQMNAKSTAPKESLVKTEPASAPDPSLPDATMSETSTDQISFLHEFRAAFRRMYREGNSADLKRLQSDPRMIKAQGLDLAHLAPPKTTTPQE